MEASKTLSPCGGANSSAALGGFLSPGKLWSLSAKEIAWHLEVHCREFSAELRVLSASLASRGGWLILGELAIKGAWAGKLVGWSTQMARGPHSAPADSLISSRCSWLALGQKLLSKVFNHSPPDQRRDNGDREVRTREDIAQGEPYTLPSSISLGKFPHQEI